MSCWVAVSLAAELWKVSPGVVLERIERGEVPARTELGFVLVDVAPDSPEISSAVRAPTARACTFTPVVPRPTAVTLNLAKPVSRIRATPAPAASWRFGRHATGARRASPQQSLALAA